MKILYKQQDNDLLLHPLGVRNCYLKHLITNEDVAGITPKPHHHKGFEIHIIQDGFQEYQCESNLFRVEKDSFLLLPPAIEHRVISTDPRTTKYSLTFECIPQLQSSLSSLQLDQGMEGQLSPRLAEIIRHISEEYHHKKQNSALLIRNAVFEILILFFRHLGLKEEPAQAISSEEDFRLTLAKQYIHDNIKAALSVSDVADYCHISTKQLTRIFETKEHTTPARYIQKKRISYIEMLLAQTQLTLKEISDLMSFTNEYYFNTFFRKHAGMTPGAYRKMHTIS